MQSPVGPNIKMADVYQEIKKIRETMVRRGDLELRIDTMEILSNPETTEIIKRGESDIAAGRVKEISSVDDLPGELDHQAD